MQPTHSYQTCVLYCLQFALKPRDQCSAPDRRGGGCERCCEEPQTSKQGRHPTPTPVRNGGDRPTKSDCVVSMNEIIGHGNGNERKRKDDDEDPEHYPPISSRGTRTPHVWMGPYQHVCKREKLHKSNLSSQIWHWTRIFKIISHFFRL